MRRPISRALLGLITTAVLVGGAFVAPARAATPTRQADAAADWLAGQLAKQNPFEQLGFPSYGPTLDALFSFADLGVRRGVRQDILETLEPDTYDGYVGSGVNSYAGPTGKLISALQEQGIAVADYANGDLLTRLEARVDVDGDDEGRAKDAGDPTDEWPDDYSNTIGQAWVVRALSTAGSGLAAETLAFLMKQQCEDGYFRESMDSADHTCDAGSAEQSRPSVDATAYAVGAMLVARRDGVVVDPTVLEAALRAAGRWLVSAQRASGGFQGVGAVSADSTGLAAVALDALGREARADEAAGWLRRHQVTTRLARTTALRAADVGAIAPTHAAFLEAQDEGIGASRINWRLATAQAAAGLDALR